MFVYVEQLASIAYTFRLYHYLKICKVYISAHAPQKYTYILNFVTALNRKKAYIIDLVSAYSSIYLFVTDL